jgi:methyl-accepting chemotaxis protein
MKITSLLPSTWNPNEAFTKLIQGSSIESSQGLSDLFILAIIYLGSAFLVGAVYLTFRSCWRTIRYRRRLSAIKEYSSARESLGGDTYFPLFHEFNHHLVDVPKQDGSGDLVVRRSVDAEEIFTDDRFAPGLSSNRIFQALPGVLTGLGVLGTFVGLQIGIGGLDLQDLKKLETSIVPLIQGCAVAFSTSVWGVGASLVFSLLEKLLEGFALGGVRKLQQRVDALVPRYVPEEAMADLARSSRSSEDMLKGLAVAIGDEMQKAIGRLGAEIKDAVVNATKEGQGPLAEQSAQLLSSAITAELGKLKETIDGMGQRFTDDFSAVSKELTQQIEAFGPTVASLAQSVTSSHETVTNAVTKLNAHESVMASMGDASEKIKKAAESFASMNETLETSASRNKDAAEAQNEAAKANQEVAVKFSSVGERLPEVRQTIEDAARVIGSLGGPLKDLKELIETLPVKQGELDSKRAESEVMRNDKLLQLTNDLATKVESAALKFAQAEGAAANLQEASERLEKASTNLGGFGDKVLQASQEQRAASEASRDAATASKQTTDALKPLPAAFTEASSGLTLAGTSLRQGADSAAASYEQLVELQRLWFQGAQTGLTALRDRVKEIIAAYGSQIEGQTQTLMNQWTTEVTECLKSYEAQVQTLEGSLEELQEAVSSIKRKA